MILMMNMLMIILEHFYCHKDAIKYMLIRIDLKYKFTILGIIP
jgi:hypothetical protein